MGCPYSGAFFVGGGLVVKEHLFKHELSEYDAKRIWKALRAKFKKMTGQEIDTYGDDIRHIKHDTFKFQVEKIDPWEHNRRVREYVREHGITDEDE